MKRRAYLIISSVILAGLFFVGCTKAVPTAAELDEQKSILEAEKKRAEVLKVATGGTTGTYYTYGSAIANVINPDRQGAKIEMIATGASRANIYLLDDNQVDLAFAQNDVIDYAYTGTNLFEEEAIQSFSAIGGLYPEICQIVTNTEITSIKELAGKTVSIGDAGSGAEINAEQILEVHGMSLEDIEVKNLSFNASAEAMKAGKIDAFFCTAGIPTTAIDELASKQPINVLSISDEYANKLIEKHPFYTQEIIPAGSYRGINTDIKSVAVKATLIVSNEVSKEDAYLLTKTIFDNRASIAQDHTKGEMLDEAYALEGISVPIHAGAEKYYKEVGVL